MRESETRMKELVDLLNGIKGRGLRAEVERLEVMRTLDNNLSEARSLLNDRMYGRNAYEKSLLAYRVRAEFPLFSHLNSIFSMQRAVLQDLAHSP
jgi:hypothetical protein